VTPRGQTERVDTIRAMRRERGLAAAIARQASGETVSLPAPTLAHGGTAPVGAYHDKPHQITPGTPRVRTGAHVGRSARPMRSEALNPSRPFQGLVGPGAARAVRDRTAPARRRSRRSRTRRGRPGRREREAGAR
jgi:hypothetical protein